MCTTCGCDQGATPSVTNLNLEKVASESQVHDHSRPHTHLHEVNHEHNHNHSHKINQGHSPVLLLEKEILEKNNLLAARNRGWFDGRNILALNLMSSPGAGKTTLLERTIKDLKNKIPIHVIEGDQETAQDAERIRATGSKVVQINTGTGCHLEAEIIAKGLKELQPPLNSVLMIENVGNLVCPALFDLGERAKILILSVTEGEDKPIKYPHMFKASDVMLISKTDLLEHVDFSVDQCIRYARKVNPEIKVFQVSAKTGHGLKDWYNWLITEFNLHK